MYTSPWIFRLRTRRVSGIAHRSRPVGQRPHSWTAAYGRRVKNRRRAHPSNADQNANRCGRARVHTFVHIIVSPPLFSSSDRAGTWLFLYAHRTATHRVAPSSPLQSRRPRLHFTNRLPPPAGARARVRARSRGHGTTIPRAARTTRPPTLYRVRLPADRLFIYFRCLHFRECRVRAKLGAHRPRGGRLPADGPRP